MKISQQHWKHFPPHPDCELCKAEREQAELAIKREADAKTAEPFVADPQRDKFES